MMRFLSAVIEFIMWLWTNEKKTPEEIEDEAEGVVANTSLGTDINTINRGLRNP